MLKIGITGNIGSGKTTVCKVFELLGIEVYYADERAKQFLHSDESKSRIKELFGEKVFDRNNNLINQELAKLVFDDKELLQQLNNIIHPQVKKDFKLWVKKRKSGHYVLKEAAILIESGSYKELDKVIVVASNIDLMIKRVKKRDNIPEEAIKKRLDNQVDQEVKIKKADHIIYNNENNLIIPQVINLHNELIKLATHYQSS